MAIDQFDDLLKRMPKIAEAVNAFKSEEVQKSAFRTLLASLNVDLPEDDETEEADDRTDRTKRTAKKRGKAKKAKAKGGKAKKGTRRPRSSTGPAPILGQLLDEGFFDDYKTLNDIIEHCKHNKATNFKPSNLSGPLGRFTRDGKLNRRKNSDKVYEYQKA